MAEDNAPDAEREETESERNARLSAENGGSVTAAVGTAVGKMSGGISDASHERHKLLEGAQVRAILEANVAGETDPDEIKAAKSTAYEAALAELDELGVTGYKAKYGLDVES